jgi:hypothetical protein
VDVDVSTSTWISFVMGSFKCFCKWEFVSVSDFDIGETEILPWWWLLDVDGGGVKARRKRREKRGRRYGNCGVWWLISPFDRRKWPPQGDVSFHITVAGGIELNHR